MSPPLKPISEEQLEENYPVKPFMPASSTQSKFFPSQPSRNSNGVGTQKSKAASRNDQLAEAGLKSYNVTQDKFFPNRQ